MRGERVRERDRAGGRRGVGPLPPFSPALASALADAAVEAAAGVRGLRRDG